MVENHWVRLIRISPNHFPLSHLGKGIDPCTKLGLSEKKRCLDKQQNLHNHSTSVFSMHFHTILVNPPGFLQQSHLTNEETEFTKWNSFKSSKFPYVSMQQQLKKFLQKELPHEPFLGNNKQKTSKREFLCCHEENRVKIIKIAKPKRSTKTKTCKT